MSKPTVGFSLHTRDATKQIRLQCVTPITVQPEIYITLTQAPTPRFLRQFHSVAIYNISIPVHAYELILLVACPAVISV